MERTALILEGGGMRGIFTAGVLDCWLDHGLRLQTVYGVSAGACQACSYLCGQKGRAARIWIKYCGDKRFASFSSWLRTGDFFNADFNYRQIPDELEPIDNGAYLRDGGLLYAVVTNLRTGQAEYLPVRDMKADVACVQASSSLPLLSRPVMIHGQPYLDGGAADSVPLARSLRDGNTRHVIILTQPAGYRKEFAAVVPSFCNGDGVGIFRLGDESAQLRYAFAVFLGGGDVGIVIKKRNVEVIGQIFQHLLIFRRQPYKIGTILDLQHIPQIQSRLRRFQP